MIYSLKKRYALLLEILIALFIITLCILPLLSPHAMILTQQQKVIKKATLDHVVNLLYVDVLEQLHKKTIPWDAIQKHAQMPIDDAMLKRAGFDKSLPYQGTFRFDHKLLPKRGTPAVKGNPTTGWYLYKFIVSFVFTPTPEQKNQEKYVFQYDIAILRQTANGPTDEKPTEGSEPTEKKKEEG